MFAIIKTGGKQYKVEKGTKIKIEKINGKEGSVVTFNDVLLTSESDGSKMKIGQPKVTSAKVEAKIIQQMRDKKVEVIKYKPKTRYKRKKGHRQQLSEIEITKITV